MTDALVDLRTLLQRALDWPDTHLTFDAAVADVPTAARAARVANHPWSLWQILEHMRRVQADVLDFCVNAGYREPESSYYWPESAEPPTPNAWRESVAAFKRDLAALQRLAGDADCDLFAKIPHGTGQTYVREFLVMIDHNSYHVGQMIAVRRALGAWPAN
ncbi:MAG: DinB family protein [Gemmatimonadaceae bacterium]